MPVVERDEVRFVLGRERENVPILLVRTDERRNATHETSPGRVGKLDGQGCLQAVKSLQEWQAELVTVNG